MRMLVLGGTGFVGRALVEAGLARGWSVSTFNRGSRAAALGVEALVGDRLGSLSALRGRSFDVVADTWAGAPRAVAASAAALDTARYLYVSSGSVYDPPGGPATVAASPDAERTDYGADKRGAELALERAFGGAALLARAGLIVGPWEDVGRLPWWLERMARGGEVLAPGPPELPLQLIDARDLAAFLLDTDATGPVDVVGESTTRELLEACRDAVARDPPAPARGAAGDAQAGSGDTAGAARPASRGTAGDAQAGSGDAAGAARPASRAAADDAEAGLRGVAGAPRPAPRGTNGDAASAGAPVRLCWRAPEAIAAAGIEPWTELPAWLPPGHEYRGLVELDTAAARAAGLRCRPVRETVADTWAWLRALDGPPPSDPARPALGLDPAKEAAALRAG